MLRFVLPLLLATVVLVPQARQARATVMQAYSLEELSTQAALIVVARARDKACSIDPWRRIVSDYSFEIEDVWSGTGPPNATITVRSLGGSIGDIGMRVAGTAHFQIGERYVLFLRSEDEGRFQTVGMAQGAMRVTNRGNETIVIPGGQNLELVHQRENGVLEPTSGPLTTPIQLDALRALLDTDASTSERQRTP